MRLKPDDLAKYTDEDLVHLREGLRQITAQRPPPPGTNGQQMQQAITEELRRRRQARRMKARVEEGR
jgi:hypothetical protein